ncbi:MAG TPA: site-2 protease family protein, partial [Polyangiaceae bacterium]|nr:site-2 protease family protein [Polyangiaceae bacterium]
NQKPRASLTTKLVGLGAFGMLLWKLKSILLLVATKGKLLLLGFTKAGTLLSMLASLGVYAALWGWKFALGLVLSIYVHEIGHVAALRKLGIAATAPMFIPGLGAFVRLKQYPASAREDAEVGLAGPVWGLGAALAAWLLGTFLQVPLLLAVARVGAWINLFNLLPFGPLDGGRGFRALSKPQRGLACAAIGVGLLVSGDGILFLLLGVAGIRAFTGQAPSVGNARVLATYSLLVVALSWLAGISVPLATQKARVTLTSGSATYATARTIVEPEAVSAEVTQEPAETIRRNERRQAMFGKVRLRLRDGRARAADRQTREQRDREHAARSVCERGMTCRAFRTPQALHCPRLYPECGLLRS